LPTSAKAAIFSSILYMTVAGIFFMTEQRFVSPDLIRQRFSKAMSDMYREEVPLYGALMELVEQTNRDVLARDPDIARQLDSTGEIQRLDMERHGAIRVGTAHRTGHPRPLVCGDGHATGGLLRPDPGGRAGAFHGVSRGA
jgi:hypothetical protein